MKLPSSWTTVTLLSKILAIALFVSLPFAGFYFGNKYQQDSQSVPLDNSSTEIEKEITKWTKPISTDKAIPFAKGGKLYTYSLSSKKLFQTKYSTGMGNSSSGQGTSDPILSPDGKYIAFINSQDNFSLYVLPGGGEEAIKITDYPVEYINSWSSDSSKILYYSHQNDLSSLKESEGSGLEIVWESVEKFSKKFFSGFHSFNLNSGEDVHLYPLARAEKFIDKNRIVVELEQYQNVNEARLVLFNVDDFTADYATVNYPLKYFGRQMSFSADGKYWATSFGNTDSGVNIAFSKFPNQNEIIVDTGSWAEIQWPLLSPDGKYLAYTKRGEQISQGLWANKTVFWNSSLQKKVAEIDGYPKYWIDGNTMLIGKGGYRSDKPFSYDSFSIFHADTLKNEELILNE